MKQFIAFFIFLMVLICCSACNQRPSCPAYNRVHNTRNYGYNPNNAARAKKNNKADIEAKKKAALSPKSAKKGKTSLFPRGMR